MISTILLFWGFFSKKRIPEFLFVGLGFILLCCFLVGTDSKVAKYFFALVFMLLSRAYFKNIDQESSKRDYEGVLALVAFLTIYIPISTLMFGAYFPIGERPRDWALLNAGLDGLVEFKEPWLSGYNVRYYVFWYLYFGFLLKDLGVDVPEGYSIVNATVMAFAATFMFRIFTGFFLNQSFLVRFLLAFCTINLPNLKTLYSCIMLSCADVGVWWSVSRAVVGGITEYPLWSFVLGDLHPHYLSTPAIILITKYILDSIDRKCIRSASLLLVLAGLYSFAANLWEVIFWICSAITIILVFIKEKPHQSDSFKIPGFLILLGLGLTVMGYTYQPVKGDSIKFVNFLSEGLKLTQTASHFGLLWLVLAGFAVWQSQVGQFWRIGLGFMLGLSLGSNSHFLFVVFLCVILLLSVKDSRILYLCLLGCAITLVPDIAYVDDPYGGPDDRLNTIFKTFYPAYILTSLATVIALMKLIGSKILLFTVVLLVPGFLLNLNGRIYTGSGPFDEIKKQFPGIQSCLLKAKAIARSVILESEETPYSWDSFFCTASGNTCYMGWSNHIGLLYRDYAEIERRKYVTRKIYESYQSCEDLRNLLKTEGIDYIFVGSLEKNRYNVDFQKLNSCLKPVCDGISAQLYRAD